MAKISTDKFNKLSILPTFGCSSECSLWSVAYHEIVEKGKPIDELTLLFRNWCNTEYLLKFFTNNLNDLMNPYWLGLSIEDAILSVQKEAIGFQNELRGFVLKSPTNEITTLNLIFEQLDKHEFALRSNSKNFRKGKPNYEHPLLRIYAIELEEENYVVTGGAIKLSEKMDRPHLLEQKNKLIRVQDFLKSNGFYKGEEFI